MVMLREYQQILKEFSEKKLSLYERACNFSEKIIKINPPSGLEKKLKEAIDFSHLQITPRGAFSFLIFFSAILLTFSLTLVLLGKDIGYIFLLLTPIACYFVYDYPFHYSIVFKIRASSEMILAIVYMCISMKLLPNLERAVEFAARNLKGPLGLDLKKILWDLEVGKYVSIEDALRDFTLKWKKDNEEFVKSINILVTSLTENQIEREKSLNEAINVILQGTNERMRRYSRELKTPIVIINVFGFLLPVIGMIFFPMAAIVLPKGLQALTLIIGYNFLLPLLVYWLMKNYLDKRPFTFHQPHLPLVPAWSKKRFFVSPLFVSLVLSLPLITLGSYKVITFREAFSFELLAWSFLIVLGVSLGISSFLFLSAYHKLKIRREIIQIEEEFVEASYILGKELRRGLPLETSLRSAIEKIKELKISSFFEKIVYNIQTFGMTFENAVFDEKMGSIKDYPSHLIEAIMRILTEVSKKGTEYLADSMIIISSYLKEVRKTEENLKELMEETVSSMKVQSLILAPLASGFVVSLTALILKMMLFLKESLEKMYDYAQIAGNLGVGILESIVNINKMMPISLFQLCIGFYLLETVATIAMFLSLIENGEENILKRVCVGKAILISILIYSAVLFSLLFILDALMPVVIA